MTQSNAPGAQPYGQPGTGYAQSGATGYAAPPVPGDYDAQHVGNTAQPMTDEGHPEVENVSVGTLLGEVSKDLSTLMRQELELAKAELRQEATEATAIAKEEANKASAIAKEEAAKAGKGAGMLGGAGFAGYMVALFLSFALWWGLENFMDAGLAALIVGVLWAIVGAVLYSAGRKKLKQVDPKRLKQVDFSRLKSINPKPEQTVDTLQQVPGALKPN
ncbi:phage holin family protein [Modestobacter sp. VKM Ac-2979]|uniref:phage holin family protein n=1 Tax=unclassified Modestobacter TaxID=2643866 RepID=UPI0022AB6042|nr:MULTISPECIES: phage holin family protein [unclassified Modestobacter]MCZ2810057.1 phage holin family protein [Modestobacter sp. VKM Ac-2979]MCZ2844688.1 phage holin family protein [Modestobacter sp. VKM Ac-2980]